MLKGPMAKHLSNHAAVSIVERFELLFQRGEILMASMQDLMSQVSANVKAEGDAVAALGRAVAALADAVANKADPSVLDGLVGQLQASASALEAAVATAPVAPTP